jgi:hypothetical protein
MCTVKKTRELFLILAKVVELGGVLERFYDSNIPRPRRRFVTPGRYLIAFKKCTVLHFMSSLSPIIHVMTHVQWNVQVLTGTRTERV